MLTSLRQACALLVLLVLVRATCGLAYAQEAPNRIALVIGNSAYSHAPALANPRADAELMSATLKSAGFEVVTVLDGDLATMKRALLDFGRQLRGRKTEAGLFYFAGHGVQVRGENYLIPVTARIDDEDEVELEGVNVNDFLSVMNSSQSAVNIVILDACRNNPFKSAARSASRGLAAVDAPSGTYIAYATSPGQVALDGEQGNSPYTKALVAAMSEPGRPIESVFKTTRSNVLAATDRKQIPWETSSITGDFYFRGQGGSAPRADAPAAMADPSSQSVVASAPRATQVEATPQETVTQLDPPSRANICTRAGEGPLGAKVCVSSVLSSQFGNAYGPRNLVDRSTATAWAEGARLHGVGELVVIIFPSPRRISSLSLVNGYAKNDDIFQKNGRIRSMSITASTGEGSRAQLKDTQGWQSFATPSLQPVSWISIEIANVYPGAKYQDTAISEIDVK